MTVSTRILVAGVGNIFLGDDGFGVEVAHRLLRRPQPEGVRVADFGIRGFDLGYALETCESLILVDATKRGEPPGTLYVIEPEPSEAGAALAHRMGPDPHGMTPDRVLAFVGPPGLPRRMRVVGCEPETFGEEGVGQLGLSEPVSEAVGRAVDIVEGLIQDFLSSVDATDGASA